MKKGLLSFAFSFAAIIAVAQTPEQMIKQFPALPSAADLTRYDSDSRNPDKPDNYVNPLETYIDRVKAKMEQHNKTFETIAQQSVHEVTNAQLNSKVAGTNVTMRQASQMNEAQLQALAQQAVAGQLGQVGLSPADLANISEDMSEEEQNALVDKVLSAQTGGLTQKDIQAMANMTDAQRAAYMKKKGLTTTPQQHQANVNASDQNLQMAQRIEKAQQNLQAAQQKYIAADPIRQARLQGEKIYKTKYAARVKALNQKMHDLIVASEDVNANGAAIDAQNRQLNQQRLSLEKQFYAEYIPIYRAAVVKMCDMAKGEFLAAHNEYKAAFDNAYKLTGKTTYLIPEAFIYQSVQAYHDALMMIAHYTLDTNDKEFMQFEF